MKLNDSKKITYIPKRPGEPDKSLASVNKIKKELGWEPKKLNFVKKIRNVFS